MCGIVGYAGHDISDAALQRAIGTLHHRGPDGSGQFVDRTAKVGLGHARLSIIDVQGGAQPLSSEEGDLVLVCNGEIYDFERIREELEATGHRFKTRSDSEVIIHLYQEHGMAFLQHLRGEFAFLLYDKGKQELLAVRDRFGIKPLYFSRQGGAFLFGSEAKALFATGALRPELDPSALRDALTGFTPDSIFLGVDVVLPGCYLRVNLAAGTHEMVQYWDLDLDPGAAGPPPRDQEEAAALVRQALEEAIHHRMRSDVPLGVYLSGGIDSAVVAATVSRLSPGRIKVFTVSFPELGPLDESPLAERLAERVGAEFYSVRCDHATLVDNTEDFLWISELPFRNFHGVGKFMLSALAKRHVTVVLTGEGSDEVFLGYDLFLYVHRFARTREPRIPKAGTFARRWHDALGSAPGLEIRFLFSRTVQGLLGRLFQARHRTFLREHHPFDRMRRRLERRQMEPLSRLRRAQYLWIKCALPQYILTMLGDRCELAHSVEGRTPFLDHHLFEAARRIPDDMKVRDGTSKYVLREAFKDDVTEEIYRRRKWPFAAPPLWLKKGKHARLDALLDEHLSSEAIRRSGMFSPTAIRLVRAAARLTFFDGRLKRGLNALLIFVLSAQILERMYVREFDRQVETKRPA